MKVRKILELSVDLSNVNVEGAYAIRALLDTLPTLESQVYFLKSLAVDIEGLLKGVEEANGKSICKPDRDKENK